MTSRKENLRRTKKLAKLSLEERIAIVLQQAYDDLDDDDFITLVRIVAMIVKAEFRLLLWESVRR